MKKQEIKKALKSREFTAFKVDGFVGVVTNSEKYVIVSIDNEKCVTEVIGCATLSGVNLFLRIEAKKGNETFLFELSNFLLSNSEFVETI